MRSPSVAVTSLAALLSTSCSSSHSGPSERTEAGSTQAQHDADVVDGEAAHHAEGQVAHGADGGASHRADGRANPTTGASCAALDDGGVVLNLVTNYGETDRVNACNGCIASHCCGEYSTCIGTSGDASAFCTAVVVDGGVSSPTANSALEACLTKYCGSLDGGVSCGVGCGDSIQIFDEDDCAGHDGERCVGGGGQADGGSDICVCVQGSWSCPFGL